ncbi:MAG: hypothetical protein KatS3mg031_0378 [Chitinophagales bacterium]|nr:MAG: hypothetical protein KatS3mg031_0378 [Chitinophagales bacterium]
MKILISALVAYLGLTGVFAQHSVNEGNTTAEQKEILYRGRKISPKGAVPAAQLPELMNGRDRLEIKVEGKIVSVCKVKGCWMMVDLGNGQQMRVTFKDYGFFVPKDSEGMTVIMDGIAYYRTTSVEMLRHYAEDAGKSKQEIAAITEPKQELAFEARGVILKMGD